MVILQMYDPIAFPLLLEFFWNSALEWKGIG